MKRYIKPSIKQLVALSECAICENSDPVTQSGSTSNEEKTEGYADSRAIVWSDNDE